MEIQGNISSIWNPFWDWRLHESSCFPGRHSNFAFIALTGCPSSAGSYQPERQDVWFDGSFKSGRVFLLSYRCLLLEFVGQLFADVALSAIKTTNSLDVLRKCHKSGAVDVPFWAPDWSSHCKCKSLKLRHTVPIEEGEEGGKGDELEQVKHPRRIGAINDRTTTGDSLMNFYNAATPSTLEFEVSNDKTILTVQGVFV